jgi:hypothetical protein
MARAFVAGRGCLYIHSNVRSTVCRCIGVTGRSPDAGISPQFFFTKYIRIPILCCCAIISRACIALLASLTVAMYKYIHLLCETRPPCRARGRQEHAACQKTMRSAAQTQAPKPWGIPSHGGVGVKMRPTPFDPMCRGRTTPPLLSRCCFHLRSQTGGAPDHECTPKPGPGRHRCLVHHRQPHRPPHHRPPCPNGWSHPLIGIGTVESGLLQARSPRQIN